MDNVTIKDFGPEQCAVFVGKRRVAYVCYGPKKPINFLPARMAGIGLTDEEKVTVAKTVREEMAKRNEKRDTANTELAKLIGPDFEDDESNGVDENGDSGDPDDATN